MLASHRHGGQKPDHTLRSVSDDGQVVHLMGRGKSPHNNISHTKGGTTLHRLDRRLPTYGPALGSANESLQTLMKVGVRHRTPLNVTGNSQHVEKLPFENERW